MNNKIHQIIEHLMREGATADEIQDAIDQIMAEQDAPRIDITTDFYTL